MANVLVIVVDRRREMFSNGGNLASFHAPRLTHRQAENRAVCVHLPTSNVTPDSVAVEGSFLLKSEMMKEQMGEGH